MLELDSFMVEGREKITLITRTWGNWKMSTKKHLERIQKLTNRVILIAETEDMPRNLPTENGLISTLTKGTI